MRSITTSLVASACVLVIACGGNVGEPKSAREAAQAPGSPPPTASAPANSGASAAPMAQAAPERSGFIASSRKAALTDAIGEADTAQRELDVAGGDCQNACRALGSMDRAAGRLCALAQSEEDAARCASAKGRVYSARDRVRRTCGSCPDVVVDRDAPIPSRP